jgi:tetratricopeptide (TPR) repeat protein
MSRKNPAPPARTRSELWIAPALAAAVAAVYARVGGFRFVNFDDDLYVTQNPIVQRGLTWEGVAWAFTSVRTFYWHPLSWLSHMLDCELYGLDPGMHHITNVFLHAAITVLLFLLLRRMTGAPWRSAAAAAVFALHPLRVESVAWVAERKDVLSAVFWVLACLAYVRYTERPAARRYLPVVGALAAGLMAKPTLVTLPFALLLLDYWPLRRGAGWAALVREKAPLFALSAAGAAVTLWSGQQAATMPSLAGIPFPARLGNAVVSYAAYLGKTFWPHPLAVHYPYDQDLAWWKIAGSAMLLAGITALVVLHRNRRYLPAGWLWFLGALVPTIGLAQSGMQSMADRFTYIPSMGLAAALVWVAADLLPPRRSAALAALALPALAIASWHQTGYWRDSVTLFSHGVAVTRDNAISRHNLGYALAAEERYREAIPHYRESVRLEPGYFQAYFNLGQALARTGRREEAIAQLRKVFQFHPGPDHAAEAHTTLGILLDQSGQPQEAGPHFYEAVRLRPESPEAHNNLGAFLARQGKREEAAAQFTLSLKLKPDYAQARQNLQLVTRAGGSGQ